VALFTGQRTHAVESCCYRAPRLGCVWQQWVETTVGLLLDGCDLASLHLGRCRLMGKAHGVLWEGVKKSKRLSGRWNGFGRVVEETDYQKEYGSRPLVTSSCPARCYFLCRESDEHRHLQSGAELGCVAVCRTCSGFCP
jgi:hypothetical protein